MSRSSPDWPSFFGPKATRGRRHARDEGPGFWRRLGDQLSSPRVGIGTLLAIVFTALASAGVLWTREQPLVGVGRVMDETRIVRVPSLKLPDRQQSEENRELARQLTPRVYAAVEPQLEAIERSLSTLPKALAGVQDAPSVSEGIREPFGLDAEMLAAVQAEGEGGEPSARWVQSVAMLMDKLRRRPILEEREWQRAVSEGRHTTIRLVGLPRELSVHRGEVVNVANAAELGEVAAIIARDSGFVGPLRKLVVNRLTVDPKPTFRYDGALTARDQNEAATKVPVAERVSPAGQVIFQRGEELTPAKLDLYRAELAAFREALPLSTRLLRWGSIVLAVAGLTLGLVGYTILFVPKVRRNISRMAGVATILTVAFFAACVATSLSPATAAVTIVTPSIFVAMLVGIGYDRRAALAYALLHAILVGLAVRGGLGTIAVMVTGIACVVTMVGDLRDRASFVRLSIVTALGVGLATAIFGFIDRPLLTSLSDAADGVPRAAVLREILQDAVLAAGGALVMGGATLFMLPIIERLFDVATGMTLIELRDPKHPLLRELQLRAPGTYNHSLNVAALAESAAQSIRADSLLTYVGALYHDVGKMNKPEYFVENQGGGPNKHDKLSPAMSLLVVVGHVKDGLELAKEYNLPRQIQHFVESHHGTTLVEYFYHRAKQQAKAAEDAGDDADLPDELEYRYPGPRPRTKEAAVLMVCDAVESATRAMSDPTPARIDALVRTIANKRLLDGQFDDCELTLRELTTIVESVSRTLASMYHGRIAYPTGETPKTSDAQRAGDWPKGSEPKPRPTGEPARKANG